MKDHSTSSNVKNIKESNSKTLSKRNNPDINNSFNFLSLLKSSYDELKVSKIIELNILNFKISLKEYHQPNKYLTPDDISLINELKEKYKNCPKNSIEKLVNFFNNKQPNFLDSFKTLSIDENPLTLFPQDIISKDLNPFSFQTYSKSLFLYNTSENNIFQFLNKKSFLEDNIFLNHKRKMLNDEEKRHKTNLIFISNRKNSIKNLNINENKLNNDSDEKHKNKKSIFGLSKLEKNKNKLLAQKEFKLNKEKKQLGRKKKNSGEVGIHNRFSKDNMMRKLKNKVMESSRKLINHMIRQETGNEKKFYGEIGKIEGVYSQDLNIKFNFWLYFQQLKDIFQFNISQKYSKGDFDSNVRLIKKIYSIDIFVKTRQLLDMKFHEYYHNIFLGENKNLLLYYDIRDNKYQLDFFLNNIIDIEKDKYYFIYRNTLYNLACKYELFFLKKNPRLTGNKKKEDKESHAKLIIKDINNEQFEYFKYLFIQTGSFYNAEIGNIYRKYLNYNRNKFFKFNSYQLYQNSDISLNSYINLNAQNQNSIHNNFIGNEKNQKIINKNNNINDNNGKHNIFYVSKNLLFEITKQTSNKNNMSNNFDIEPETKQNVEKEIQTENQLNNEDSSYNIEILL